MADLGIAAGTQTTGQHAADLQLVVGQADAQGLDVGVGRQEFDVRQVGVGEVVDGIAAAAANPYNFDAGAAGLRLFKQDGFNHDTLPGVHWAVRGSWQVQ